MWQTISKIEHENGARAIVYKTITLENRYGIHTNNPGYLGGSSANDYMTLEDLRQLYEDIGNYLDILDLERYKTSFCQIDNKHMTIHQYASDVFGSRYKANNWFKRQHSLTLEEVETKLGQIEHGVFE